MTGTDIYYDPKEMRNSEKPKACSSSLNYGLNNCPELLKTGWESMEGMEAGSAANDTQQNQNKRSKKNIMLFGAGSDDNLFQWSANIPIPQLNAMP